MADVGRSRAVGLDQLLGAHEHVTDVVEHGLVGPPAQVGEDDRRRRLPWPAPPARPCARATATVEAPTPPVPQTATRCPGGGPSAATSSGSPGTRSASTIGRATAARASSRAAGSKPGSSTAPTPRRPQRSLPAPTTRTGQRVGPPATRSRSSPGMPASTRAADTGRGPARRARSSSVDWQRSSSIGTVPAVAQWASWPNQEHRAGASPRTTQRSPISRRRRLPARPQWPARP